MFNLRRVLLLAVIFISVFVSIPAFGQSWTPVNNVPGISAYNPTLLTDGSVMIQDGDNSVWWKLTPDNNGNYANGTWTQLSAPDNYGPLYYASAVLPDGRVFTMGGEYNMGQGPLWQNQGFIYDPMSDTWTQISAPAGWDQIGDMGCVTLPNGKVMICNPLSNQAALFDPVTNTITSPYGSGKADGNDEEGLTLLPNGTILTVDTTPNNSEIFNPATGLWTSAGQTPATLVGGGEEIGPQVLRPDGTVICFGGGGHNCVYDTKTGTWSVAPDFPNGLDCADAPACLLPNGKVLVMAAPGLFGSGVQFFEWDGTNLNPAPTTDNAPFEPSFVGNMLMLPSGQVLLTDQSNTILLYTPTGSADPSWAPTITNYPSVVASGFSFQIFGTQFNGLSTCSAYGDDEENFTNYPMIRITNKATGHVFYCREFNPSTMAICTGSQTVNTNFTVPDNIELGASTIQVVTNGIASAPKDITVAKSLQLSISPNVVPGGSSSTGTVTYFEPAPAGGVTLKVVSDTSLATVPATITIPSGASVATFAIATATTTSSYVANITCSQGTAKVTAAINVFGVASIAFSPGSVSGGNTSTGTVTLGTAAPAGGVSISLSSNSATVTVPGSVTIPAGATSATITATTQPVAATVNATISATLGNTVTGGLTVTPATLTSIALAPPQVVGGVNSVGTVTLGSVSVAGGTVIGLTSSDPSVTVPASVTVPGGATSATFTIATTPIQQTLTSTITASQGTVSKTATLTVLQPALTTISVSPNAVVGGVSSTGTVVLSGAAPQGGEVVALSSNSGSASVLASVTVPAGSKSATFTVLTKSVTSDTNVSITGILGTVSLSATLTVQKPYLASVSIAPSSIIGGNTATGTVTLARAAPAGGIVVSLSVDAGATVPSTLTVPVGASSATFPVQTFGVAIKSVVTVTASTVGVSLSASVTVTVASLGQVTVNPNPAVGGTSPVGTASLNGTSPTDTKVALVATGTYASVPATVTIPANTPSTTFAVTTKVVTANQTSTINATAGGVIVSTLLTITPNAEASFTIAPGSVVGGSSTVATGTVTFNGPAPGAGEAIKLVSSNPKLAIVPPSVRLLSAKTSVAFAVVHKPVTSSTTVTVTATYGTKSLTASITLTPFEVQSVSMSPSSVTGGGKSTGTVTLNAAPGTSSGAILVKLSSSSKSVTVPLTVSIPVGKTSGTFLASTSVTAATSTATITATYGSTSAQATLTVVPPTISSLSVSPTSVKGSSAAAVTGTVTLSGVAPTGGVVVSLSSSAANAGSVPASVTVPAGKSTVTFKVSHSAVTAQTAVTISGTTGTVTKSAVLTVKP